MLPEIAEELADLRRRGLYRSLAEPAGADFCSNDYLGFARHPALRSAAAQALRHFPVGATASRLLRGHWDAHAALEQAAARFFESEAALFFANGYLANLALFSALLTRRDAVVFDEMIHASAREGIRASGAKLFRARHNEVQSFADAICDARREGARRLLIAVETLYSMDGDFAPLAQLSKLAGEHDAILVIDEAHATGIFGSRGRGCGEDLDHDRVIALHTCGKALGVTGALICAPRLVVDYLTNRARPFIYSTAPPPLLAAAVMRALELIDEESWRRSRVLELAQKVHAVLSPDAPFRGSQIIPVILGDADRALAVAAALQRAGYDVRAVRPPTVPEGTARLRIAIHADHSDGDIEGLSTALRDALAAA